MGNEHDDDLGSRVDTPLDMEVDDYPKTSEDLETNDEDERSEDAKKDERRERTGAGQDESIIGK